MVVNAEQWFTENAVFRMPTYRRITGASASSSGVRQQYVDKLNKKDVPVHAFLDPQKVNRLIDAADRALRNHTLVAPNGRRAKDSTIKEAYAELFSPKVESKYGVMYDGWKQIYPEKDCQDLTRNAVLYSVRFAAEKIFDRKITTRTEPLNPGTVHQESKERVDLLIEDATGNYLYLCEIKTPVVLDKFEKYIGTDETHDIQLRSGASVGENVLNKAVYYMCLFECDHLVLTSFEKVCFFERHWDEDSGQNSLLYSVTIDQDGNSEVFRALLGLTLYRLGIVPLDGPPVTVYNRKFLLQSRDNNVPGAGPSGGPGPSGGAGPSGGSGRSTGGHDLRPKRFSGKGSGGSSTKRHCGINSLQVSSPENHNITNILSRSTSWSPELREKTVVEDAGTIIKIMGGKYMRYGSQDLSEFELELGVKFPSFPTSDKVPVLKIVDELGQGATGIVYKAELLHPDNCDDTNAPSYAIKLVDSEWRSSKEYRNFVMDLHDEYINYCLLELGKRYPPLESIIRHSTATCYGLYRLKDYSSPKFALITEYCGESVKCSWAELGDSDKCAVLDSLICLHALGLEHNDVEERNVVFDDKTGTYKFIDLCASAWHTCPGIQKCKELLIMRKEFKLFEMDLSLDYQDKVIHDNKLMLLDTRFILEHTKEVDVKKLATSVRQLAEELDREM